MKDGVHFQKMYPTQIQNAPRGADSSISESILPKEHHLMGGVLFLALELGLAPKVRYSFCILWMQGLL